MLKEPNSTLEYQRIEIEGGVNLPYLFIEPPTLLEDETLVLFLHEGLGSIAQWKEFPSQLCSALGLKGIVYEREGYGHASPLRKEREVGYLEDYALKELPKFIQQVLPHKKVILFGHSDGGSIALIYAAKFPENVKAVVTEAAHVFVEEVTVRGIEQAKKVYETSPKLKAALSKYHSKKTDGIFYAWCNTWLTPEFFTWNVEHFLPSIQASSLIIQGLQDEYGSRKQVEAIVEQTKGPSEGLLIEDCGHTPHKEQKDKVIQAVKQWYYGVFTDQ